MTGEPRDGRPAAARRRNTLVPSYGMSARASRVPRATASFPVGFENHVSGPRRCKTCTLTSRFPEKCSVLPDPRARNLRPGTLWLRRRTARIAEYRGHYALTRALAARESVQRRKGKEFTVRQWALP
ncbi:hypothetical protein ISCGN_009447 [Ixodes scapularis]